MKQTHIVVLGFLAALCLPVVVHSGTPQTQNKPTLSTLKRKNKSLQRKLLHYRMMIFDLYRKQRALVQYVTRIKKAHHTSCFRILKFLPGAKSGLYELYRNGTFTKVYCDMKTAGGGWTRFIHHSDPNGRTPISRVAWDKGIQFAADGGIKQWMVKTYTNPNHNSQKSSKFTNAWILQLAPVVQDSRFARFQYHKPPTKCGKHRYRTTDYVAKARLVVGSQCKAFFGSLRGTRLWGEYRWCDGKKKGIGWLWMPRCAGQRYLLTVNYGSKRGDKSVQTRIGLVRGYDTDGGGFEFFYR